MAEEEQKKEKIQDASSGIYIPFAVIGTVIAAVSGGVPYYLSSATLPSKDKALFKMELAQFRSELDSPVLKEMERLNKEFKLTRKLLAEEKNTRLKRDAKTAAELAESLNQLKLTMSNAVHEFELNSVTINSRIDNLERYREQAINNTARMWCYITNPNDLQNCPTK